MRSIWLAASQGVPGSHEATAVLVRYSQAALHKDWPLAWAAAPILEEASVPPATAWTALGLRSPPLFSTVLQHLRALSSDAGQAALSSWPARGPTAEQAFGSILDYISAQVGDGASKLLLILLLSAERGEGLLWLSPSKAADSVVEHAIHLYRLESEDV